MSGPAAGFALLCALACGALLVCERRQLRAGVWLAKPVAAGAFVAVGLAAGALESGYGRLVLLALGLSWLGDVLLIPSGSGVVFLLGMGSFLAAHLAYGAAFWSVGPSLPAVALAAALLVPAFVALLRWLGPHLEGPLRRAVPLYAAIIAGMLALAAGAAQALALPILWVGAALFALSDLSVARERFVRAEFRNSAWGLPTYFAAQLLLAWSVAAVGGERP